MPSFSERIQPCPLVESSPRASAGAPNLSPLFKSSLHTSAHTPNLDPWANVRVVSPRAQQSSTSRRILAPGFGGATHPPTPVGIPSTLRVRPLRRPLGRPPKPTYGWHHSLTTPWSSTRAVLRRAPQYLTPWSTLRDSLRCTRKHPSTTGRFLGPHYGVRDNIRPSDRLFASQWWALQSSSDPWPTPGAPLRLTPPSITQFELSSCKRGV